MHKRFICVILCLCLLLALPVPVFATGQTVQAEEETTEAPVRYLRIHSREQLLQFAKDCRLDSYSRNLQVVLTGDIDLTGVAFESIPIFCGTFLGRGHKITGLTLTAEGSVQGLFRYLTDTAVVQDLHVSGTVIPTGSRSNVGGIAGSNAGRLENCSFTGTVEGVDYVGGLAGINTVSAIIENCSVTGIITGHHFTGGIAGVNNGVIRSCENNAQVNTTVHGNTVDLSDVTLNNLTGAEAANTTTDVGGIAGSSTGVIRNCTNRANIGYQKMGYNIGGIAGSQSGYIIDCQNYGQIHGRKEIGGIVGQMEPATQIEYSPDALQILDQQLNTLSGLAGSASYHAQSNADGVSQQITQMEGYMENAIDAVETLFPTEENPEPPDPDTILAAQNTLSESLVGMQQSVSNITASLQGTLTALARDMQAISAQVGAMGQTLKEAGENISGTLTDVSDQDTAEDATGKVTGCINYGPVLGDLNVGGVVGAMALENKLDQEDNLEILGDSSMNFTGQLRSVVTDCQNHGTVTCKKQYGGGIVGWQSLGLVRGCLNTGALDASGADYVGGIAGRSDGRIRLCSAKCELSGSSYVGGIAGSACIVTDCRSMTLFGTVTEKMGEVLGERTPAGQEEENPVYGNLYLSIGRDWGAIDGISYAGCAEPMTREAFMALEGLPDLFKTIKVHFVAEGGEVYTVTLEPGGALDPAKIPAVPEKTGYIGIWAGLESTDLSFVEFDTIFPAEYTKIIDTLQSDALRPSGQAVLLAQGQFPTEAVIPMADVTGAYSASPLVLEAWEFTLPDDAQVHTLRFCLPDGYGAEDVTLSVLDSVTGNYHTVDFTVNGSYIVFSANETCVGLQLQQVPADYTGLWLMTGGAVALAALIVTVVLVRKRKKKTAPAGEAPAEAE